MSSIRKSLNSGILYTAITKYSGILISILVGSILARLLSPEEFGIVALVTVFISFFNIFSDVGIGPAIIQNKELNKEDVQSIFTFSLLTGLLLAIAFFISAHAIASFYDENKLIPLIKLFSLTVLFSAFRIVPTALLLKSLRFKELGIATIVVQLTSGIAAIILAIKGYSYYTLVYKSIFDGIFTFVILYKLSPIKFKLIIKLEAIRKIFQFSTYQFLFNFINYFSRNLDNILIGKYISPTSLGFYDKSYQLMTIPVQNLTHVITPVLQPILSNFYNEENRIYNAYLKVLKLLAIIGFPLSVFLYFSAAEIIFIIYGKQWENSIPVFKILACTIGIQMLLSSSGAIFQALNQTKLLFYSGVLSAIFTVSGICYGVFIGRNLEAVGYGLLLAFIINFFQAFYLLIKIGFKKSFKSFLNSLIHPIFISVVIAILLCFFVQVYPKENIYSLFFKFIITLIAWILLLLTDPFNRSIILDKWKNWFSN